MVEKPKACDWLSWSIIPLLEAQPFLCCSVRRNEKCTEILAAVLWYRFRRNNQPKRWQIRCKLIFLAMLFLARCIKFTVKGLWHTSQIMQTIPQFNGLGAKWKRREIFTRKIIVNAENPSWVKNKCTASSNKQDYHSRSITQHPPAPTIWGCSHSRTPPGSAGRLHTGQAKKTQQSTRS